MNNSSASIGFILLTVAGSSQLDHLGQNLDMTILLVLVLDLIKRMLIEGTIHQGCGV